MKKNIGIIGGGDILAQSADAVIVVEENTAEQQIKKIQLNKEELKQSMELKQLPYEYDSEEKKRRRVTAKKPYWKNGKLKYK